MNRRFGSAIAKDGAPMAEADPTPPQQPVDATAPAPAATPAPAAQSEAPFDPATASFDSPSDAAGGSTPAIDDAALEELLKLANEGAAGLNALSDPPPAGAPIEPSSAFAHPAAVSANTANFQLPNFQQVIAEAAASSIDLLRDVQLNVKIELGRSRMMVEDVLKLAEGSVVELDKLAGDPVDVFVNERLVARGEVLVLNDNFCVRVSEIVGEEQKKK
jgi:flagellar motor switch protein FliN/FliY